MKLEKVEYFFLVWGSDDRLKEMVLCFFLVWEADDLQELD
jgi:hypothetical protein